MRGLAWITAAAVASSVAMFAAEAAADTMDPALERLALNQNGTGPCDYKLGGATQCVPNNPAWFRLANQLGFALAPTAMHPARTTGFGGFVFSIEGAFTAIDNDAPYWQEGTRGTQDANTKRYSIRNSAPDPMLQVYMLKIRKGFPFGFELTGNVGYVANTSLMVGGADLRWSILEGFRKGIPGMLPDIAIGGSIRTTTGTPQMNLTVAGADGQISKPLPIADSGVLTPYVGYQWIRIFGDTGLIDATPNTDPLGYCGYAGSNSPGTPDPNKSGVYDGQPVCTNGGSASDFNNTFVFDPARITRHRIVAGLNYRYEALWLAGQFITDAVAPADANSGAEAAALEGTPKQWTMAFEVGVAF